MAKKKLIETALPLKEINEAAAREKSIRHGHPSTLHLWWSRKPTATTRAVLFASIVDDPGDSVQRKRLFEIIKALVKWEGTGVNLDALNAARNEIIRATGGNIPAVFDPFAGGGAIPLEAQRLGLNAFAADLNPVAVLINKAMIEIPATFNGKKPVHPDINQFQTYAGAQGLAEDIRYYGTKLKNLAAKKIGSLYPTIDGKTVIAWIWARTVQCPNPACRCQMPLVNSFTLSKKQNKFLVPVIRGKNISYEIADSGTPRTGTVDRNGATCVRCNSHVDLEYVKTEGKAGRMGAQLLAIVADGNPGRIYLPANDEHIQAASVDKPNDFPNGELPENPRWFSPPLYGLKNYADLFTNRQLTALTTFGDLLDETVADIPSKKYARAVKTYLAFVIDKLTQYHSSNCPWDASRDGIAQLFGRQAIPMIWVFAEANPFSNSSGCFDNMLSWVVEAVENLPLGKVGEVRRCDATVDNGIRNMLISTDPPYYDNIGYANLSDFFYVWLRRAVKNIYPEIFTGRAVPKLEELVADPYRQGGRDESRKFFEGGMKKALAQIYAAASEEYPVTIYYAFKQKKLDGGSTGWETMLKAVIDAGFEITGTLPMRTELVTALKNDKNALSTSIVLVCRKRAPVRAVKYEQFLAELDAELELAIKPLQEANLTPVDMAQAAIGPGMSVYSRYGEEKIISKRGKIDVAQALQDIDRALTKVLDAQGLGLDAASRFYVKLYESYDFEAAAFGEVEILAKAYNVAVELMSGLESKGGKVRLLRPAELEKVEDGGSYWIVAQKLAYQMKTAGNTGCGLLLSEFEESLDNLRNLLYRLYQIADNRRKVKDSVVYNDLIEAWAQILNERHAILAAKEPVPVQTELEFGSEGNDKLAGNN